MKPRRVRFTLTAREQIRREKAWWLENRVHTDVFVAEVKDAVKIVAVLPGAGSPYSYAEVPGLCRVYLRKIACHLHYTFDEHDVIVRALWSARRERGPLIEP